METIILFCTVPNNDVGVLIAQTLVERRLAACVNIIPGLTSVYFWKDEVCKDQELLLIIKTKKSCYAEVENEIKHLHPYEVPEIIALPIISGSHDYLEWLCKSTK